LVLGMLCPLDSLAAGKKKSARKPAAAAKSLRTLKAKKARASAARVDPIDPGGGDDDKGSVALEPSTTPGEGGASAAATGGGPRGPTRIDFDDRLIQGQSNKAGAVYLYDRKQLKTETLIKYPKTFRREITDTVY
jgi:hypothetical protein